MKVTELSEDTLRLIRHIVNWDTLISDDVANILHKLSTNEGLTELEDSLEVIPSEVAAIWSVANRIPVETRYVREVKRDERIAPTREWGAGPGRRSLYRVGEIKGIRIANSPGRHKGSRNRPKAATPSNESVTRPLARGVKTLHKRTLVLEPVS